MRIPIFLLFVFLALSLVPLTVPVVIAADYTLPVFGNANMDKNIDDSDIEYVKGIINGNNKATQLADANYDGKIDENDTAQIELILAGTEKQLTVIDDTLTDAYPHGRPVTVKKPAKGIVGLNVNVPEALRILGSGDRNIGFLRHFVGIAYLGKLFHPDLFPELINKEYLEKFQEISYMEFYIYPSLEAN